MIAVRLWWVVSALLPRDAAVQAALVHGQFGIEAVNTEVDQALSNRVHSVDKQLVVQTT